MPRASSSGFIVALMLLVIAAIGAAAYWDEERESAAALNDFAGAQTTLARAVASLAGPLDAAAMQRLRGVEEPGSVIVLVSSDHGIERPTGDHVRSEPIEAAIASRESFARLKRTDASALGLPARAAIAGVAHRDDGGRAYDVVIVATALRERDREDRAAARLVLALTSSIAIVLAFGTLALRKQRAEMKLAHDLAVADASRARDERLMRADRLATLGALATGIAHEVSTPLGVIVGRADQLAKRMKDDERALRATSAITEQVKRIDKIVRGFLSLARGEATTLEEVACGDIVRDALDLVEHRFEAAHVRLEASVPIDLPAIACEPKLFTQVLVNLLLNACDACTAGGRVVVRAETQGRNVAFIVEDDGHGITNEASARAKEPFFTTKPPGKGTGLGLAIASEIVSHHCGTLTLSARNDGVRGTVARVDLAHVGEPTKLPS